MIEFKGAYFRKGQGMPQSVLVQFDGVLLHVWHTSDPFHRLLTSDVFRLPASIRRRNHLIRLPNGGRIETDDLQALEQLQNNKRQMHGAKGRHEANVRFMVLGGTLILLAGVVLLLGGWVIH